MTTEPVPEGQPRRLRRLLPLLTVALVIGAYAGSRAWLGLAEPPAGPTMETMFEVTPGGVIDPSEVPEVIAVHYRAAFANPEIFAGVPCFCGCDEMLGHRHLLDCFARPDGGGWEAHAAGCGVCLGEAEQIEILLAQGVTDPAVIRAAVIERWSDPYMSG